MPTFTKQNVALSITPEEAEHMTPAGMDNLSRLFERLQEPAAEHATPAPPVNPPPTSAASPEHGQPPTASKRSVKTRRPSAVAATAAATVPANADTFTHVKAILDAARPSHRRVYAYMASKVRATTPEIGAATDKTQSEISRAMSLLRATEKTAGLFEGELIKGQREDGGKTWIWTAGSMLLKIHAQQPKLPSGLLGPSIVDDFEDS